MQVICRFILLCLFIPASAHAAEGFGLSAPGTVDTTPPEITLISPVEDDFYGPEVDFQWFITENSLSSAGDAVSLALVSSPDEPANLWVSPFEPSGEYQFFWTPTGPIPSGSTWRVTAVDAFGNQSMQDGSALHISNASDPSLIPSTATLQTAFPNPFNPTTTLRFSTPKDGQVNLEIFDPAGRRVHTLHEGFMVRGWHEITWQATDSASGVYFAKLRTGGTTCGIKLILIK